MGGLLGSSGTTIVGATGTGCGAGWGLTSIGTGCGAGCGAITGLTNSTTRE